MRLRTLSALAAFALVTCAAAPAQEQQQEQKQEQQVIEDFVTTRGVSFDTPTKKPQKQGAQTSPSRKGGAASKGGSAGAPAGGVASNKGSGGGKTVKPNKSTPRPTGAGSVTAQTDGEVVDDTGAQMLKASAEGGRPLALGYTVLLKDGAGRLSFVDAAHEFKTGDSIAIALETNADGYLYMFNASDGRNPELLFPNAQLDGGTNSLQAHARATFPADLSYDFRFTDPAAKEHLFVVLSREPLAGVPTGAALVEFCGANVEDCAWKPPVSLWERIRGGAKGRGVTEARNTQLAQASQPVMPQTLQRGLKVKKEDPKPAVVRVNNSADADILVTEIVLVHR